jgi:hypothetical protein
MSPSLAFLSDKADPSGILPPWNLWWDEDIAPLFPTPDVRRACEAEMRRFPLCYFEDRLDGTGWDAMPSAYLAFGGAYAAEHDRAAAAGWPALTLDHAEHLHMLVDPDGVAAQIVDLLAALDVMVA